MGMLERLNEFISFKGYSMKAFEESVGMSNGSLGTTIKNGKGIRSDMLEKILSTYPELSAEWLLRGTGNIIVGDGVDQEQLFKAIGLPANSREIIQIWMKYMEFNSEMQKIYQKSI